MKKNSFAIFILSHGRAGNISTLQALKNANYTGDIYILIDDEDDQEHEYRRLYGDMVVQFSKEEMAKRIDVGDNFPDRKAIVYARNAVYDVAKELGYTYFLQLDDDYTGFNFRKQEGDSLKAYPIRCFDDVVKAMIQFLEVSGAMTVCFNQGGDMIGGVENKFWKEGISRKAMNSFFCKVDRRINFVGKLNEDVSTYCLGGSRGELFFSYAGVNVTQKPTQSVEGGITEAYKDGGTYLKTFYSVMYMPSAIKISTIGTTNNRVHHKINWKNVAVKILREEVKKK